MLARLTSRTGSARPTLAVLCAGLLVLGACGGNGNGNDAAPRDLEDLEDLGDELGLDGLDPGDFGAFGDDECFSAFLALSTAFAGAFMPTGDLDESFDALERFASDAPSAIQDDFDVLLSAFRDIQETLEDAGIDMSDPASFTDPDAIERLEAIGDPFGEPEVEQAAENIEAYFDEVCAGYFD